MEDININTFKEYVQYALKTESALDPLNDETKSSNSMPQEYWNLRTLKPDIINGIPFQKAK